MRETASSANACQNIELGQGLAGLQEPGGLSGHLFAQGQEQLVFLRLALSSADSTFSSYSLSSGVM